MRRNITSADNSTLKAAIALQQKKQRDKMNCYLLEGPNLICEALDNGGQISELFCSDQLDEQRPEYRDILMRADKMGFPVYTVPEYLFIRLSDTKTPQGIAAVARKEKVDAGHLFHNRARQDCKGILVLDRIQDPGNLGTLLRTADAAGFLGVVAVKGTGDFYSPKVVRSAAGALFRIPVLQTEGPEDAMELLRQHGKKTAVTVLSDSSPYYECDLSGDVALIIGNEGNGVSDVFLRSADMRVHIPMRHQVESLNAAVAAGVLLYESARQNQLTGKQLYQQ